MASLTLANDEIVRQVLQIMGLNRTAARMDAATEADLRAILRAGLRRFYFPTIGDFVYQWRWLEKHASFSITPNYETGTVTVAAGTVTLAGGTWPSYAADMFIRVDGHVLFVTSRDSDTTLTVSNSQLAAAAGTSYIAYRYRYELPSDFSEWIGGVVYANGSRNRMLAGSSESEIRLRYAVGQYSGQDTSHYAITSTPSADEMRILLWPVPEPDAFIQGTYLSTPADNLPADLTTPGSTIQVQPIYAEAVVEAILAAAEAYHNDEMAGMHEAKFQAALRKAIAHDKSVGGAYDFSRRTTPDYLGHGPISSDIDFTGAIT